jgi:TonB family protein
VKTIATTIFIVAFYSLLVSQSNVRVRQLSNGSCAYFDNETQKKISQEYDHCFEVRHQKWVAGNYEKGMGLYDLSGNEILPPIYKYINTFDKFILVTEFSKKKFLTRNDGSKIHEGSFDEIIVRNDFPYFIAKSENFYHLLDSIGKFVLTNNADSLYFTNIVSYLGFMKGGKHGVMNIKGKIIHTPVLDAINKINSDSILLKLEGKWHTFTPNDSTYHDIILNEPFPEIKALFRDVEMSREGKKVTTVKSKNSEAEKAMLEFLYRNLRYPSYARGKNIEGQVVIRFTINMDGSTSDFEMISAPHQSLADAAIDVAKIMVFEKPAMFNGKPIKSKYTLPVKFKLQE